MKIGKNFMIFDCIFGKIKRICLTIFHNLETIVLVLLDFHAVSVSMFSISLHNRYANVHKLSH